MGVSPERRAHARQAAWAGPEAAPPTSRARGVEMWQANFRVTPERVTLEKVMPVEL